MYDYSMGMNSTTGRGSSPKRGVEMYSRFGFFFMGLTCHVGKHLSRSMLCRQSSFCCAFAYATGQLILFSESENIVFQVRKHYFLSQKTLFSAYARNRVRVYMNKVSVVIIP